MVDPRLDRQLRIEGWNQAALEEAHVGVLGDDDLLASIFVLSASALGLNNLVVLTRRLDKPLVSGRTGVDSCQAVPYRPGKDERPPAELLGLYQIVGRRRPGTYGRIRASCAISTILRSS